jgi:chemotaxis protein MotB
MRPRKPKVVKENSERWLLTYSDLITLLMIFFILLYAMSTTNTRKFQDLTGALKQAFNNGQYQMITLGGSPGNPQTLSGTAKGKPALKVPTKNLQLAKLATMIGEPTSVVTLSKSREGIVLSLAGNLLFYPGDTKLKPESFAVLSKVSSVLGHLPNLIRIEGNTDAQGGSTAFSSSWALSAMRAVSIVEYLSTKGGINPHRLQVEGLGEFHPVASNSTAQGRARNRRADIVILYP